MRKKITWQFWSDPYTKDRSKEFLGEEEGDKVLAGRWDRDDEDAETVVYDEKEMRAVLPTSRGMMPIDVHTVFNSDFRIWLANTTFIITEDVKAAIMNTPGVDGLEVTSPYSFRFIAGKAFDAKKVRLDITKRLGALPPSSGVDNPRNLNLSDIPYEEMAKEKAGKDHWAVIIFPDATSHEFDASTEEEFDENMKVYNILKEITGAAIYSKTFNS